MSVVSTVGSGADLSTLQLKIGGMSCSFCASSIEKALCREKGVDEVHVSLAHEETLIRYRAAETTPGAIETTMRALGFIIRDPRKVEVFEEQEKAARTERLDLTSAAVCAVALILAMAGMWLGLWRIGNWQVWTAWAIATYVLGWNGRRILRMAWIRRRRRAPNAWT